MNRNLVSSCRIYTLILFGFAALNFVNAYPPAPHHTLYGMVRNQWGEPIDISGSVVILETESNATVTTTMVPGILPGVNYEMNVPMDSGTASDLYQPSALQPFVGFRLKVRIGQKEYLPIEMSGDLAQIGEPGGTTRIDLTLGEDTDGDGLPDAWELELIAALGGGLTLEDIDPDGDEDLDGLSNLAEYLAGTYAFEPSDGFRLTLLDNPAGPATMEFLAVGGRTYTIESSLDLETWTQVPFRTDPQSPAQQTYLSVGSQIITAEVPSYSGSESKVFFRALSQ